MSIHAFRLDTTSVRYSFYLIFSLLLQAATVIGVGSETKWPHVSQAIVRQCANHTIAVQRQRFCKDMANCILSTVDETIKSNMAAGSSMMALLPTALWVLASTMEDVVSIARRDPWIAVAMSFVTAGSKGILRNGSPAEIDAGNWYADTGLPHRLVDAVVVAGLMNVPEDPEIKIGFIKKELHLLHMKDSRKSATTPGAHRLYQSICWLLRLSSWAATALLLWLYVVRQDTCYVAFNCPKTLAINVGAGFIPALFEYIGAPLLEYREYWTIEGQELICHTRGKAPLSARGALRRSNSSQKRDVTLWQFITPGLITQRPLCVLVWRRRGLRAEIVRTFLMILRAAVYLFQTVFFSAVVLMPAAHATQIFMGSVGVLLYDRMILIALDALPGATGLIQEVGIR